MFIIEFFIHDYKQKHNDFICVYFGHHLEKSCFHCGDSLLISHFGDPCSDFKKCNDNIKDWFAKI